jgi:hypothetical protein
MTRKIVALLGFLSLFFGLGLVQASADDNGYNPPPAVADNCDAGHGAFGAFSHHFQFQNPIGFNWIAAAAQEGGIGDTTGPANSDLGQTCRTTR